jgi:hypothetical protein
VLGIYNGLRQGGVAGYGGAAINAGQLAGIQGVGALAAPLATYNFAKNWKSGATGADALSGLGTGAAWGTAIAPGIGTLIGAGIGLAAGAASSIFGPGKMDAENVGWDQYAKAYQQGGAKGVSGASPSQNYQALAGIFDSRGSSIPFYGKYGRMGEQQFTTDMASQINSAISSGKITKNASPDQIYSQVVQPWISSMSKSGWQNTNTAKGAPEKQAVGNLLTSMIGQWQSGQLTAGSKVGINGQTINGLPLFGGGSAQQVAASQLRPTAGFGGFPGIGQRQ